MDGSLQPVFNKLQKDLQVLFNDLANHPDEVLNKSASKGEWSIHQVMHHLLMTEDYSIRYLKKKLSFEPELKKANIGTGFRNLGLKLFALAPFKVKAPEAVSGENLPDKSTFWEVVKLWNARREEMENFLDSLPDDVLNKEVFKHPTSGRLTIKQMLEFHQIHFNRHRKQIRKLVNTYQYVV